MLASSTKDVTEFLFEYAKEGQLIQIAVLLLVANERIMDSSTFQRKDGGIVGRGLTIRDIVREIVSQADAESKVLVHNGEQRKLAEMSKDKRVTLMFTLMLLKIFERAGDAIRSYLRSLQIHVSFNIDCFMPFISCF